MNRAGTQCGVYDDVNGTVTRPTTGLELVVRSIAVAVRLQRLVVSSMWYFLFTTRHKTLSSPGLPMDTLLWYCLLWMVSASRIPAGCMAVAPGTRLPRVRPHVLASLEVEGGGNGGRLVRSPCHLVRCIRHCPLVPFTVTVHWAPSHNRGWSDGDVTPRKDTREDFGPHFNFLSPTAVVGRL